MPQALLFAIGMISLSVLLLVEETRFSELGRVRALNEKAELALRLNTQGLIEHLQSLILEQASTSALLPSGNKPDQVLEPVLFSGKAIDSRSLHSPIQSPETSISFRAVTHPIHELDAGWLPLPGDSPDGLALAWAAEDCRILSEEDSAPDFWPLPYWNLKPYDGARSYTELLDQETGGNWIGGPWIPLADPIPFLPDESPACVPVPNRINLRLGIFASGPIRNREKTVRVRYYIEGEIWNPYNRPMQFHTGSVDRSLFQILFYNLPEVRILNRSLGFSSGWISLDDALNSASRKSGLSAWIAVPPALGPGQHHLFSEPNSSRQPEGLARTLHPGFPVGPADQIEIEFRVPPSGSAVACLPDSSMATPEVARNGAGWFALENFSSNWPNLTFGRADEGPRPFYIQEGSLAFRRDNAHLDVSLSLNLDSLASVDPRRSRILLDQPIPTASGHFIQGDGWFISQIKSLTSDNRGDTPQPVRTGDLAIVSWPAVEPGDLLEATDLPGWENGYLLGSSGASGLNGLLDSYWIREARTGAGDLVFLEHNDGQRYAYRKSFHINNLSHNNWLGRLKLSGTAGPEKATRFPAYPTSHPSWDIGNLPVDPDQLRKAVGALVEDTRRRPYRNVSDFFNRGKFSDLLKPESPGLQFSPALPLRAWLREAPAPVSRGSSWILHVAVRGQLEESRVLKTARVWLLETPTGGGSSKFSVIRFEWTNPDEVLG